MLAIWVFLCLIGLLFNLSPVAGNAEGLFLFGFSFESFFNWVVMGSQNFNFSLLIKVLDYISYLTGC